MERLPQRMWTNALTSPQQLEAGHEGCGGMQRKGLATGWLEREAEKAQKSAEILVRCDNQLLYRMSSEVKIFFRRHGANVTWLQR